MGSLLRNTKRLVLISVGGVSLALGLAGLVLPVLPTTPFLLLAAWCFLRSSESLHRRLLEHRLLGGMIRDYTEGRGLPRRTKVVAIAMLWIGVLLSAAVFVPWVVADALLVVVAAAVTAHLLRLPTAERVSEAA